jgi:hypothetical protein
MNNLLWKEMCEPLTLEFSLFSLFGGGISWMGPGGIEIGFGLTTVDCAVSTLELLAAGLGLGEFSLSLLSPDVLIGGTDDFFFFLSFRFSLDLTSLLLQLPWLLASMPLSPSSLSTVSFRTGVSVGGSGSGSSGLVVSIKQVLLTQTH